MLAYFTGAAQSVKASVVEKSETEYAVDEATGLPRMYKGQKKEEVRRIVAEMPTFERYANSIGVTPDTLDNWARDKRHPEFGDAYKRCKAVVKDFLIQGLISGRIPSQGGIFVACNVTDMTDRTESRLTLQTQPTNERPVLSDRTPQELEVLKGLFTKAESLGYRVTIEEGEKAEAES
jgi:hypothetical protein